MPVVITVWASRPDSDEICRVVRTLLMNVYQYEHPFASTCMCSSATYSVRSVLADILPTTAPTRTNCKSSYHMGSVADAATLVYAHLNFLKARGFSSTEMSVCAAPGHGSGSKNLNETLRHIGMLYKVIPSVYNWLIFFLTLACLSLRVRVGVLLARRSDSSHVYMRSSRAKSSFRLNRASCLS